MNNKIKCVGCGATIQNDDADKIGYMPQKINDNDNYIYCQRCFKLRNYNQVVPIKVEEEKFIESLSKISYKKALIVYIVDIFDFKGSLISGLSRLVGNNDILLVANKVDLLPSSVKLSKIKTWIQKQTKDMGLKVKDVIFSSGKKNKFIDNLLDKINTYRLNEDAYLIGVTNVGKSTLLNKILSSKSIKNDKLITTSYFPGTTLGQIEIPLDNDHNLIDTAGIINKHQMIHFLNSTDIKYVIPSQQIKSRVYQLKDSQTLFMGALARFDYIKGNGPVVAYFSNDLSIHRTKMDGANNFYKKHAGKLLAPVPKSNDGSVNLSKQEFKTISKSDIVFSGLGWVTVPKNTIVAGFTPNGVEVSIRPALI